MGQIFKMRLFFAPIISEIKTMTPKFFFAFLSWGTHPVAKEWKKFILKKGFYANILN